MIIVDRFYIALFSALEQTQCARMWFHMSDWLFIARFLNIHRSGVPTALAWLVPHGYATSLGKPSANGQFFVGAQMAVCNRQLKLY